MIFQLLVFLFIVFLTLYLATQGSLSAMIAFITATFASILAGGLYEPLAGTINSWRPDYGQGVTFLLTFFLAFSALRIVADIIVSKNVHLPLWVDRVGGGFIGFFASMVVAGTTVLGIEMMPLPTSLMEIRAARIAGWDRYPDGVRGAESNLWLNPNGFVEWIYHMTLSRSLGSVGGTYTFSQAHPDLGEELWGYRHRTQLAAQFKLPSSQTSLAKVAAAWTVENPDATFRPKDWPSDGDRALVVRTEIEQGTQTPHIAADRSDDSGKNNFRATRSQVRLVVVTPDGDARQFYPAGYIDHGPFNRPIAEYRDFGPRGHVVLDFPEKGPMNVEWVFAVPERFDPARSGAAGFVEIKGLTRLELGKVDKSEPKGVAVVYPPLRWLESPFTLTVSVKDVSSGSPQPVVGAPVYYMANSVNIRSVSGLIQAASSTLDSNVTAWRDSTGGWGDVLNSQPGGANRGRMDNANRTLRDLWQDKDKTPEIAWSHFLPHLPTAAYTVNSADNVNNVAKYIDEKIRPALDESATRRFREITDKNGTVPPQPLADGTYCVVTWYKTADTIYLWARGVDAKSKNTLTVDLTTDKADFIHSLKK